MTSLTKISPLSFILILLHSHHHPATATIYEILPIFGLPGGLFPDSVKNYTFSIEDGTFAVELEKQQPCYVQLEDYMVCYDELISGTLKIGSITNLEGVRVKWLMIWLKVDEIKVDLPPNDNIYLQFGLVNKKLDVNQFRTIHSCTYQDKLMFKRQGRTTSSSSS
ncbi:hypothetical protein SOVF_016790 [Spinacia oleracea]|nr:hypothetical protein SOVF_016790 [Spinacia oleracea]